MIVYIDESGDIGWNFNFPYRKGGSSRYLTISLLIIPNDIKQLPKRIVKKLYKEFHIPTSVELKGCDLSPEQIKFFCEKTIDLLQTHPEIKIATITVYKENVNPHIRDDGNKIYNYMIGLALLDEIKSEPKVLLVPDPRSIKVKSGNSLTDYLQVKLWYELDSITRLENSPVSSDKSDSIKFIDMVAHIIWSHFEDKEQLGFKMLSPYIKIRRLYFP